MTKNVPERDSCRDSYITFARHYSLLKIRKEEGNPRHAIRGEFNDIVNLIQA